jgi:hypothetical protein
MNRGQNVACYNALASSLYDYPPLGQQGNPGGRVRHRLSVDATGTKVWLVS